MIKNKKAQVWIETVLYTLMAIALIGVVLGFVMPKINQTKDKLAIEQTISMLTLLDDKIVGASDAVGSSRLFDFTIKRGELYINSSYDKIEFLINDLNKPYSEPGSEISSGAIKIYSSKGQKKSEVRLVLDYSEKYNLTYNGAENDKKFSPGSVPYKIKIENQGISNLIHFDITD
jgi:hypothetical protein